MAIGPIVRVLVQVIGPVIMRAIPAAYAKAIQNAAKNGTAAAANTASNSASDMFRAKQMSKAEALQILNIEEADLSKISWKDQSTSGGNESITPNIIEEQYNKYMNANAVKRLPNSAYNTGSFYLQSKIHHAKETLLKEVLKQQQESQSNSQ